MNDIDLSSYSNWDPIGEIDMDTGTGQGFTGSLDGNGYTISNLTINRPDEDGVGLFAIIGDPSTMTGGEVKNLGLMNVNISGNEYVGALAPCAIGNISNCFVSGEINGAQMIGGFIGMTINCNLNGLFADVNVSGTGEVVGGLVAQFYSDSQITNSAVTGTIEGYSYVGGLLGQSYLSGEINNSYSTCDVTAVVAGPGGGIVGGGIGIEIDYTYSSGNVVGTNCGGINGYSFQNSIVKNSVWNASLVANGIGYADNTSTDSNNKGLTTAEMQDPANWQGWDTNIWDFSTYPPTFKMYTPTGGGSTGGGMGGTDPSDPSNPDNPDTPGGGTGGAGDVPIPGAVRLQIGSDSSSTSAIYVDTSFDLGAFDVDFSSADSCAAAIEDIDEVLSRINTKRSEFGAVINRLSSILESQTTTIQNFTSAKSTIMDADIANESADFVKNQILQQTSSALLAQSQNLHASIVLSLIG